jgi:hypothetical protein
MADTVRTGALAILAVAALTLGACQDTPSAPTKETAERTSQSSPAAAEPPAAPEPEGAPAILDLPPPGAEPRFIGHWAASAEACPSAPWRFTAEDISGPDGKACRITKTVEAPGGYDLSASCGSADEQAVQIRFAESAQAMLIASDTLGDIGLVFCGREP